MKNRQCDYWLALVGGLGALGASVASARSAVASLALVTLLFCIGGDAQASIHPFHISVAEMEFNEETKRFEVSLKMHAADLENAIAQRTGKRIDVEEDGGEEQIIGYLNEHFRLFSFEPADRADTANPGERSSTAGALDVSKRGKAMARMDELKKVVVKLSGTERTASRSFSKLHFVGKEMETTWVWIYFEMELPGGDSAGNNDEAAHGADSKRRMWGFQNSILLDVVRDQINTVSLRAGGKRVSLKLNGQAYLADFDSEWFAKAELADGDSDASP